MPAKKRRLAKSFAAAKATKSARPPDLGLPTTVASQWARVARVHGMINRGERVTAEALAVELELEARTMYRTFDFMRDELGLPLDYSYEVKSFVYMRPCPFLPLVRITPDEDFALTLMKQMFGALAGTPVGEMLNSVLKKISVVVGRSVSFSSASFGDVLTPSSLLSETAQRHLGTLFVAIRNQQAVRLNYQNARATSPRLRLVHPLHLACLDDRWFLLAYDPAARAMRTFILARIHGLEESAEAFDRPADFDATKVLGGNLGAYTGTEDHVVKVKLRDAAAVQARERKWHHSQVNTERGDGALEIALRLNNLVDVQNAVLRWGPLAEAIEPMALRTQVREALKLAAEQYGGGRDQGPMTND